MAKRSMIVSLIGRPNVGKSSLFNRIMQKGQKALTYDMPGVTRDRHYGIAHLDDLKSVDKQEVILVDTGGFYPDSVDENSRTVGENQAKANHFFNIMTNHAQLAIDESDLVLFVVDVREGLLPFDKSICDYIRTKKKKIWLLINKFDSDSQWGEESEFYSLGFDDNDMLVLSAEHGRGMEELREKIQKEAYDFEQQELALAELQKGVTPREEVVAKVAIIGRPNAGKSTLLNQLVGANRALVSNIAGTTVDPIEAFFDLYFGKEVDFLEDYRTQKNKYDLLLNEYEDFRKNNADFLRESFQEDELEFEEFDFDDSKQVETEIESLNNQLFENLSNDDSSHDESLEKENVEANLENEKNDLENLSHEGESEEELIDEGSYWRSLHIIDTAGIRKQKTIKDAVEEQSVYRSLRCISESDIVIHLVDATLGIGHQDRRLIDIALEKGKSVIVCLNKFDLIQKDLKTEKQKREWILDLRAKIPWLSFCDVIPISAKYNKRISELKKSLKKTTIIRHRRIGTGELNRVVGSLVERNPIYLQKSRGKTFKVKYASMIKSWPPTFLLFSNKSKGIPDNFKKYLKNGLRRELCLDNTPVHLIFRTGFDLEQRLQKSKF